jgi:predicted  nucleic acid-binding Zn-ribbon protein
MYTQEDRLAALEQKVAALERQVFARQAEQGRAISDLQHDLTILLGLATKEVELTNGLRTEVSNLKENMSERFDQHDRRFDQHDQQFSEIKTLLAQHTALFAEILARLPEKPQ